MKIGTPVTPALGNVHTLWAFLPIFVFELGGHTEQTDRHTDKQTDRQTDGRTDRIRLYCDGLLEDSRTIITKLYTVLKKPLPFQRMDRHRQTNAVLRYKAACAYCSAWVHSAVYPPGQ